MSTEAETMDAATLMEELQLLLVAESAGQALFGEEGYHHLGLAAGYAGRAAALQAVADERGAELAEAASLHGALLPVAKLAALPPSDRVRALAGNALRLRCHSELACEVMTCSHLLPPGTSGEYVRSLALVHWERARPAEAVALLERAERLLREAGLAGEALATRRLRVLLHAELGDDDEALWLYETTAPAAEGDRPWLSARAALTAAFCLVARGEAGDVKAAGHALAQGRELATEVTGEAERLHLAWLAARAQARRTGGRRAAEAALAELAEPALRLWPGCEVSLLTLDLCVCHTPARKGLDLAAVAQELRRSARSAADEHAVESALVHIRGLASALPVWEMAGLAGRCLRNTFRLFNPAGIRPIPFQVPWPGPAGVPAPVEA